MEKKVVHVVKSIRPGGGPAGYLYNLHEAIRKSGKTLPISVVTKKRNNSREGFTPVHEDKKFILLNLFPKLIRNFIIKNVYAFYLRKGKRISSPDVSNNNQLIVHDIFIARYLLNKNHSQIFIMPHSPVEVTKELFDNLNSYYKDLPEEILKHWQRLELNIYMSSRGIVCPGQEALEGYFSSQLELQKKIFSLKKFFVISGVTPLSSNKSEDQVRRELGIPSSSKVLGFFGRYNDHKGFDKFINIARHFSEKSSDSVFFISCGTGPITPPKLKNYLNLGWRKDVANYINITNRIFLLNQYTYFDLLPLEAFSLGKKIFATPVGGNKILKRLAPEAVTLIEGDSEKDYKIIETDLELPLEDPTQILNTYNANFSVDAFLDNHIKLAEEIIQINHPY